MEIDHIFIFSNNKGKEADELIDFGFVEGKNRRHIGQGTINRKFYFENFFLEILWVENEDEIKESPVKETQLWERSNFNRNGQSRFGLCLVNTEESDELFEGCQIYQPRYFPEGLSIELITNSDNSQLPWTFRLPYRGGKRSTSEHIKHLNGIKKLTKTEFGVKPLNLETQFIASFEGKSSIVFKETESQLLVLEFDSGKQQKIIELKELNLKIKY